MKNPMMRRGFTLVELVVASSLTALVLMMATAALKSCLNATETSGLQSSLECKAASAVELMSRELKDAGTKYPGFAVATDQRSITFARCQGYSEGKPVFGNRITYAVNTYNGALCLERTEVVNGTAQSEIMTDQLNSTTYAVKTAQGSTINVVGANFQLLTADTVVFTVVLAKSNYILKENTTTVDDRQIVTCMASVQMQNN